MKRTEEYSPARQAVSDGNLPTAADVAKERAPAAQRITAADVAKELGPASL